MTMGGRLIEIIRQSQDGYRNHGEGVESEDEIIYQAPDSILVSGLMHSLFQYINENDVWRGLIGTQSDVLGQYVDFTLIDNVRNGAQLIQEESKNNLSDDLSST